MLGPVRPRFEINISMPSAARDWSERYQTRLCLNNNTRVFHKEKGARCPAPLGYRIYSFFGSEVVLTCAFFTFCLEAIPYGGDDEVHAEQEDRDGPPIVHPVHIEEIELVGEDDGCDHR